MLTAMSPSTGRPSLRDRTREEVFALIRGLARPHPLRAGRAHRACPAARSGHAVTRLLAEGRITESHGAGEGPGLGQRTSGGRSSTPSPAPPAPAPSTSVTGTSASALGDDMGNVVDEVTVVLNVDRSPTRASTRPRACSRALCERNQVGVARVRRRWACPARSRRRPDWSARRRPCPTGPACSRPGSWRSGSASRPSSANDASVGAVGELYHGAGRGHRDFLYIKASHGVGAGLVVNGQPYQGGTGFAGEIGHIIISGRPELCRCGNRGCLEAVVSVPSVREQLGHTHPHLDPDSIELSEPRRPDLRTHPQRGRPLARRSARRAVRPVQPDPAGDRRRAGHLRASR